MIIIGVDYHPEFQQLAFVDTDTGELSEARLRNPEQAEQFYRELAVQGAQVRIGMEASGHARWLERLFAEVAYLHFAMKPRWPPESGEASPTISPNLRLMPATYELAWGIEIFLKVPFW